MEFFEIGAPAGANRNTRMNESSLFESSMCNFQQLGNDPLQFTHTLKLQLPFTFLIEDGTNDPFKLNTD
jgi:hypothetical protein